MKQCPVCKAVYADDAQSFCLSDGTMLLSISDEEETRVISFGNKRMNTGGAPPAETMPAFSAPPIIPHQPAQQQQSERSPLVPVLVGLLFLVVLCFAGFIAYTFLKSDGKQSSDITKTSPTASQTPDETTKLKEQVANLEKKIEAGKNQKTATPVPSVSKQQTQSGNTARVNSPGDGFLALRSEPNAETGYRIARIPHGADVDVISCQSYSVTIGSRRGRWCQVSYAGQTGWAFDAFLVY